MDTNVPQMPQNENGVAGKPLEPTITGEEHVYKSYEAATADLTPTAPEEPHDDIYKLHNEGLIPPLRTYESDVAEALKKKDASVVKIAVAEQKKVEEKKKIHQPIAEPVKPQENILQTSVQAPIAVKPHRSFHLPHISINKNALVAIISIVLIAAGGGALSYLIYMKIKTTIAVAPVVQTPTIISTDSEQKIMLPNNETIIHALETQHPLFSGPEGSLVHVLFVSGTSTDSGQSLDAETFIERWPSTMPSWLARSFNPDFIFGYQLLDTPQPFIIFKITSYDDGFAGMLKWEDTMENDIAGLEIAGASSTTLQASSTQALLGSVFQDTVVDNKDVRVLHDASGNPLVMYSLPDKQTIVITTNETTLKEIFARLSTSQFTQ